MEGVLIVALLLLLLMPITNGSEPYCTLCTPWPQCLAPKIIYPFHPSLSSYLSELLEIKSHPEIMIPYTDSGSTCKCCSMNGKVFVYQLFVFMACVADEPQPQSAPSNTVATVHM